jgi:hypothetical protein
MTEPLWVDIENRDEIGDWLNRHGLTGAAAEIGCAFGGYAREVLSKWNGKKYYMVDPWIDQPKSVYRERTEGISFEQYWRQCSELAEADKRVVLIRKFSVDGALDVPDNSLDMVFIDGNHDYIHVLQDADAWWPKLKSGGVMGFDDYGNDTNWPNFIEVKKAVDRWCAEHQLTFVVDRRPAAWVIKRP